MCVYREMDMQAVRYRYIDRRTWVYYTALIIRYCDWIMTAFKGLNNLCYGLHFQPILLTFKEMMTKSVILSEHIDLF